MGENIEQAEETAQHVEQASQQVSQAASTAPTNAIEDALKSVHESLDKVMNKLESLVTGSAKTVEQDVKPAETTTAAAAEPVVNVTKPEKQYRTVRRYGRKVKREV